MGPRQSTPGDQLSSTFPETTSQSQARSGAPTSTSVSAMLPDSSETTDLFDRVEETTDAPVEETTDAADDTELPGGTGDDLSARRVFFVGISGPSCGGKTTLARELAAQLKSPVVSVPMDGYFVPSLMPSHPRYGQNWETPQGVDFKTLLEDMHLLESTFSSAEVVPEKLVIKAAASRGGGDVIRKSVARSPLLGSQPIVVVVEGFLLFYDSSVSTMFDAHLWLQADCQTCCRRRHERDAPGVPEARFSDWYSGLVWSHFQKYQDQQLANADGALRLDGTDAPRAILEKAVAYCQARLGLS